MQLYFQYYPQLVTNTQYREQTPVIIIPGLFGSTVNWRSFAKKLAEIAPVYVIDQRNHGRSAHAKTQSYLDMVEDLINFLDQNGLEKVVLCGHSMGGKTAMLAGLLFAQRIQRLIVLDIAPVNYTHSQASVLQALRELDLTTLKSRKQADDLLKDKIKETATRLFVLQNLAGKSGEYFWRINIPVLLEAMPDLVSFPESLVQGKQSPLESLFIAAGQADFLKEKHYPTIRQYFPHSTITTIEEAGHWFHVQQPEAVLQIMTNFINPN